MNTYKVEFENGHSFNVEAYSTDDIGIFEKVSEYLYSQGSYICTNTGYTANEIKYKIIKIKNENGGN